MVREAEEQHHLAELELMDVEQCYGEAIQSAYGACLVRRTFIGPAIFSLFGCVGSLVLLHKPDI
jgi:hypothetical protein